MLYLLAPLALLGFESTPVQEDLDALKQISRVTAVTQVYQAVSPSVVFIQTRGTTTYPVRSVIGNRARTQKSSGSGTGVVIHEDGYFVTNYHVVRDADPGQIQVSFVNDPIPYRAELLSYKERDDLALLRILGSMEAFAAVPKVPGMASGKLTRSETRERTRDKFPTVRLGTSADLMHGERVIAIGNPHGQTNTVSEGIISGLHRDVQVGGRFGLNFSNLIQTDASINLGNSGGPLLNVHGELIGINTVMNTAAENIGFAIPVDKVREVLTQELFPEAHAAWTGIDFADDSATTVANVWPGSPASLAGICSGDQVLRIAGNDVNDSASLLDANLQVTPFRNTEILIQNAAGERISKQLTPWDRVDGYLYQVLGCTTEQTTDGRGGGVVLVNRLRPDGPAEELGLTAGDWLYGAKFRLSRTGMRSKPIGDRDDLYQVVSALDSGTSFEIEILRDLNSDGAFTRDERHQGVLKLP